jgi:hypothetical protein
MLGPIKRIALLAVAITAVGAVYVRLFIPIEIA